MNEGSAQWNQLRRGGSRCHQAAGVLRDRLQKKSGFIKSDVVLDQIGIAFVLQLTQQLGVADVLGGILSQSFLTVLDQVGTF